MTSSRGVVLADCEGLGHTTGSLAVGCKVNWSLEVLGRREDGFHELRSWFLGLDGGDLLSWSPGPSGVQVDGPECAGVPSDARNLVLKADQSWRASGGEAPSLLWRLGKFLPVGSGLGAGSADAAAVLKVLQACASRPLAHQACRELALSLGSDVPFFFDGEAAVLLGGRGEQNLQQGEPPQAWIVLAIPPISAATPQVFAALQAPDYQAKEAQPGSVAQGFPSWPQGNALAPAALRCIPGLVEVAEQLLAIASFQLSGSGSAWFTVVHDGSTKEGRALAHSQAESLAERVRECGYRASVHRPWLREAETEQ